MGQYVAGRLGDSTVMFGIEGDFEEGTLSKRTCTREVVDFGRIQNQPIVSGWSCF
jgi:hypothetical protein